MRLTRFNKLTKEYEYHLNNPDTSIIQDEITGIQKLGQLEDIEEELGIDLITLFKVLKNGVWIKYKRHFFDKEYTIEHYSPEDFVVCFQKDLSDNYEAMFFKVRYYGDFYDGDVGREIEGDFGDTIYLSENYGKTWALTKEELEKGE